MANQQVQTLRSSVSGNLPTPGTRKPGELFLNFADWQLGFIDAGENPQKLLPIRAFQTTASYAAGDFSVYSGALYFANVAVSPGAWNATQWTRIATLNDLANFATGVAISDTPPASPKNGNLWYDSADGQLYIYYDDGNTKQWVVALNQSGAVGSGLAEAPTDGQSYGRASMAWKAVLPLSGGTLTGPLILAADPTVALGAATQQFVYAAIAAPAAPHGMKIDVGTF